MDFHLTLYIKEFPATLKELQEFLQASKSPVSIVKPDELPIEEHQGRLYFSYQNQKVYTEIHFHVNNRFKEPIHEKVSQYPRLVTFGFRNTEIIALRVVYMLCLPIARKYNALFRDNYYNVFLSSAELAVISTELNELYQHAELNMVNNFYSLPVLADLDPVLARIGQLYADFRNSNIPESVKREYKPREVKTLSNVVKLSNYFECQWCQWKFPEPRKDPFCNECKARCHVCGTLNSSCNKPGAMQFTHWKDYWIWVRTKHEKANSKLHWMYPY